MTCILIDAWHAQFKLLVLNQLSTQHKAFTNCLYLLEIRDALRLWRRDIQSNIYIDGCSFNSLSQVTGHTCNKRYLKTAIQCWYAWNATQYAVNTVHNRLGEQLRKWLVINNDLYNQWSLNKVASKYTTSCSCTSIPASVQCTNERRIRSTVTVQSLLMITTTLIVYINVSIYYIYILRYISELCINLDS